MTLTRWLIAGFLAGAVSVLLFHQGMVALLHLIDAIPRPPYSTAPTQPWGVPQIWSTAFWGGVWGIALAAALRRMDGARLIMAAVVFGVVLPTLVAWFIVAPLKGQPMASGFVPGRMLIGPIVNGAWGVGVGFGLALFGRRKNVGS
jgi:hypothetical protein